MKKIEQWQEEKEQYILNDRFMLKRADKFEFGIHETIYSNVDLELSFSWEKQTVDNIDYDNHFWIFKDDKRIGGVYISPNLMGAFFMEAPYVIDRFIVISTLNDALLQCVDKRLDEPYTTLSHVCGYYDKSLWVNFDDIRGILLNINKEDIHIKVA